MTWCSSHLNWATWVWKAWIIAAALAFLDAASILLPSLFGPLNFFHNGRPHAYSELIQGTFFVALALAFWQFAKPTHKLEKGSV